MITSDQIKDALELAHHYWPGPLFFSAQCQSANIGCSPTKLYSVAITNGKDVHLLRVSYQSQEAAMEHLFQTLKCS